MKDNNKAHYNQLKSNECEGDVHDKNFRVACSQCGVFRDQKINLFANFNQKFQTSTQLFG
jgi:hypothetical protein